MAREVVGREVGVRVEEAIDLLRVLGRGDRAGRVDEHAAAAQLLFFFSSRRRHTRSKRDWSSDVCSSDLIGAGPGARVWNLYGPTETTIYSGGDAVAGSPAPIEIGSIIAGTRLYVLDARQRPVPPGVFGEVCIGGAGVAHGYHGAPGLTAARFRPDPFAPRPGGRLYRTGDVGRWRRTGRIELAG